MAGVTKEEIARAKELDLLTYFKLVEPGNLKLVGKEYRHKVHSSLTISKDSLWCWHCIGLRGRTALKYLIDVEKVPYVEAVREINRIQGGVVHSSQPVSLPQPCAEPEAPRDFKLPKANPMTGWRRWHRMAYPTKLTVPGACWNAMWQTARCNGRSLTSRCSSCRHWSRRVLSTWHGCESDCRCGMRISRYFKVSASSIPVRFHYVWAAMYRPPQNRC